MEGVQAAAPTKQTYLSAQYHRLAARRDKKKAAVAMGHTIPVIAHHLLSIDESVYGTGALTTSMNATASP